MWFIFIILSTLAAIVHARLTPPITRERLAELCLVYLLAGICGILQIAFGFATLFAGDRVAAHMHVPPGNPGQVWMAFLIMGMGATGTLAIWLRGSYLIAPAISWAIFFAGATYAHVNADALAGHPPTVTSLSVIFLTHTLTALLLPYFLWASRTGRARL